MKRLFIIIAVLSFTFIAKAQEMPEHILKLMYTGNIISRFYVDETDNDKITETGIKAIYATTHSYVGSIQRNAYHVEQLQIMTDTLCRAAERLGEEGKPLPIVVAGDFNVSPRRRNVGHSYEHMVKFAEFDDAKEVAEKSDESGTARVYGNDMQGHDGTTGHGERIDFFFSQGMDIERYNVLNGMFRPIDDAKYEYVHEDAKFDGSMYDLSDHQPIYSEISIGKGEKYVSHREDKESFYKNPITAEDDVVPNTIDESPVIGAKLKFERCRILPFIGGGYNNPTEVALVEDKEKGRVLRFISAKNASLFEGVIEYAGIFGRYGAEMPEAEREKIENVKKLKVTFKTEMSIEGVHLDFFVLTSDAGGSGQYKLTKLPTDINGEWRTLEIDVSSLSGAISKIGVYGRSHQTGLLRGDAVYIESIDFE